MSDSSPSTHRQILKSSALIGGSSLVNVLLGLVRTKFTAIYLGTLGVGVMETLFSITQLVGALAGVGVGRSGVRQVAEAAGMGDPLRLARTVLTIRQVSLGLGILGMGLMAVMAWPVSQWTFENTHYAGVLAILSVTVLLSVVSDGQIALIQGCRRIADLARARVLGVLLSILISIPMMIIWGQKSVVPILLCNGVTAILASWYYARKIQVVKAGMSWGELWREAGPLVKLGAAFVSSGLMVSGVAYLTRVIINRRLDLEAIGLYAAAWKISSYYVGFILESMGADFYPRLSVVAKDNSQINRLVNEQTEVSLLLTLPGLVATLTFAPWVIHLLYSADFIPAGEILRWQVVGLVLRVLCWPMGFILMAKGSTGLFFACELAANLVHLGLIWVGVVYWGLPGAGAAYLGLYIFYAVLIATVTRRVTGFRWSASNWRLIALTVSVSVIVFLSVAWLPKVYSLAMGSLLIVATGLYSLKMLALLTGGNPVMTAISKFNQLLNRSKAS